MARLTKSLRSQGSEAFRQTLKAELEGLASGTLPLEKGCSRGGVADDREIAVRVLDVKQGERFIRARVGVFFSEVVAGCSCRDDPLTESAYCEMELAIDRESAEAEFVVVSD
jgi:hypothetical protein